jgi:hydrogenase expression/formation protein HypD
MKYVDEFRDAALCRKLAAAIGEAVRPDRAYHLMEFCGGHTHALCRYGLLDLMPPSVRMVHGPGCPVCVLPIGRLEQALSLARRPDVVLCTFGDLMRVPGKDKLTLQRARAEGADVRMVASPLEALRLAAEKPDRKIVFFAIGFETTTPTTAAAVKETRARGLRNVSFFINHVLTPAAIQAIVASKEAADGSLRVDGFIGPGHVSTVIGSAPYEPLAAAARRPIVISGFEPADLLQSILMLVRQLNEGRFEVENQFSRGVTRGGNRKAQALVEETMTLRPAFDWRGLGALPSSALRLRDEYRDLDAEVLFDLPYEHVPDHKACACGDVLKGLVKPTDCTIFGSVCTPETPVGSCMVSPEGSCAAYYLHRRRRGDEPRRDS